MYYVAVKLLETEPLYNEFHIHEASFSVLTDHTDITRCVHGADPGFLKVWF